MTKIVYFADVSAKPWGTQEDRCQQILNSVVSHHPLVIWVSNGISSKTLNYLRRACGAVTQDFWEARARDVFEFPIDQRYLLSDMVARNTPGEVLQVLYRRNMREKPYRDDLVLWQPVIREKGDELPTALNVAYLHSLGFRVLDEYQRMVTPNSIAPYELIGIEGPGRVTHFGKNNERIRERLDAFDRWGRAMQRSREQMWRDITAVHWRARENNRVAFLHSIGHFAVPHRCPF